MSLNTICPYPGLRPFNEEEAIFFKGREEHIDQIIKQLEVRKFLMLTGASGDGKSSLVYAGVIPNAKAGFFKAKFNNWIVADFRPERSPLSRLAQSIQREFRLESTETVKKELSYGFSALADIYKSSEYWVDLKSQGYLELAPDQQKKVKRKGANLMILVDQFEEFFTNPENYHNGKTSLESQTVVNLLLETSKLAIEQDLPIYIICTMRSDYIGQCASFRGLPEYIGYSQFFVPRLKRRELYQVIEEPAKLNGNRISKRLVEMLLNEMSEGVDQLPVLQHALNQIWQKAAMGQEEMDLIHFAMINGIPKKMLSDEDRARFENWFNALPEFKKHFFEKSSLGDVLDAHANELYESANFGLENQLDIKDAKLIIKTTFKCLTKIDESRAVRNRMTLREITQIINREHIDVDLVAKTIEPFRMQGNTFLKPFFNPGAESRKLSPDTVLDITHESLIRNWDKLEFWAKQENEHLLTWQDFRKQLQRWLNNNKSSGYLLPIGSLSFFESWFTKIRMNKYWLASYDERELEMSEKIKEAEQVLADTRSFLKHSARRLFFSRLVLKHGADKLISVFAIVLFIASCIYFYFDYRKKENDKVVESLLESGKTLLTSNKVKEKQKALFVIHHERLQPFSAEKLLNNLGSDTLSYDVAYSVFELTHNLHRKRHESLNPLASRIFSYMDSVLNRNIVNSDLNRIRHIKRLNLHARICAFIHYHTKDVQDKLRLHQSLAQLKRYMTLILKSKDLIKAEEFNSALQTYLSFSDPASIKVDEILDRLSPFSNQSAEIFQSIYPFDQSVKADYSYSFKHKAGYQMLSYLYACKGDFPAIRRCLDSIYKHNPDYDLFINNGFQDLLSYLAKYQSFPSDSVSSLISSHIAQVKSGRTQYAYFTSILDRCFDNPFFFYTVAPPNNDLPGQNLAHFSLSAETIDNIIRFNINHLNKRFTDAEERNINLALLYKRVGVYYNKVLNDSLKSNSAFEKAIEYYQSLSKEFLSRDIKLYDFKGVILTGGELIKNSVAFLNPVPLSENIYATSRLEPAYCDLYECRVTEIAYGTPFYNYLEKHGYLKLYEGKAELTCLENYCYRLVQATKFRPQKYFHYVYNEFESIVNLIQNHKQYRYNLDSDFVNLVKLKAAMERKDSTSVLDYAGKINLEKLKSQAFQNINELRSDVHLLLLKNYAVYLAGAGKSDMAISLIYSIKEPWNKRNSLIDVAYEMTIQNKHEYSYRFIDSMLPDIRVKPKFGMKYFKVLGMIGSEQANKISLSIFKDIDDKLKPRALKNFISGVSHIGLYHQAFKLIPNTTSRINELELYCDILHSEVLRKMRAERINAASNPWFWFDERNYGKAIEENYEYQQEHFDRFVD